MIRFLIGLYKRHIDFVKFIFVGIVTNIIFAGVYEGTIIGFDISENMLIIPYGLAFGVSSFAAYLCNKFWVFKGKHNRGTAVKFYVIYGSTFAFQLGMVYFVTHVLNVSKYFAFLPGLCVTIPVNFLVNRFWTFRNREGTSESPEVRSL